MSCPISSWPPALRFTSFFRLFRIFSYAFYTFFFFCLLFTGVDVKPSDVDGLPYSTLLYGNGPGHSAEHRLVPMLNATDAETHNRLHGAAVPRQWATHGGEDVPVYAAGPPGITQALFSGTFDQSFVPHAIAYVACLAEHAERCRRQDAEAANRSNSDAAFAADKTGVLGVGPSSQVTRFSLRFFVFDFIQTLVFWQLCTGTEPQRIGPRNSIPSMLRIGNVIFSNNRTRDWKPMCFLNSCSTVQIDHQILDIILNRSHWSRQCSCYYHYFYLFNVELSVLWMNSVFLRDHSPEQLIFIWI